VLHTRKNFLDYGKSLSSSSISDDPVLTIPPHQSWFFLTLTKIPCPISTPYVNHIRGHGSFNPVTEDSLTLLNVTLIFSGVCHNLLGKQNHEAEELSPHPSVDLDFPTAGAKCPKAPEFLCIWVPLSPMVFGNPELLP